MRIILNTTKLLSDIAFLSLSKDQIIAYLKVCDYFGKEDGRPIQVNLEMLALLSKCTIQDLEVLISKDLLNFDEDEFKIVGHVNYFKNNLENVKKSQAKNKGKTKPEPKKGTDWQRIMKIYNDTFKNHQYVKKLISLNSKRGASLNARYEEIQKMVNKDSDDGSYYQFDDIYHFAEEYFKDLASRKGVADSWQYESKGKKRWMEFDFDKFFEIERFNNIVEKDFYL